MTRTLTAIIVLAGGILFTGLVNIRVPDIWMDMAIDLVRFFYIFNNIFPMEAIFNGLWMIGTILFYYILWEYLIGVIGFILGSGKPEID